MDDDFNTGGALGELFEIAHAVNRFANPLTAGPGAGPAGSLTEYRKGMIVLKELSGILGLFSREAAAGAAVSEPLTPRLMSLLIGARAPAPEGQEFRPG